VLEYHRGPKNLCVDLGTGHGVIARNMSPHFKRVIGVDPSASMVKQATTLTKESNIEFHVSGAEDLSFLEDGTIDMAVAGEAAHWFDYSKVWPELKRKLRTGGTVTFWGYKDHACVDYPKATKLLREYCYGPGTDFMGPYWEQPGTDILRQRLASVVPPETDFTDITRLEYEPGTDGPNSGMLGERLMYKTMTLGEMEGYVRTFSSYANWAEAHPDRRPKAEGGPGDVVDRMFEAMLEAEPDWKKEGENWRNKTVECEWGTIILMARKR